MGFYEQRCRFQRIHLGLLGQQCRLSSDVSVAVSCQSAPLTSACRRGRTTRQFRYWSPGTSSPRSLATSRTASPCRKPRRSTPLSSASPPPTGTSGSVILQRSLNPCLCCMCARKCRPAYQLEMLLQAYCLPLVLFTLLIFTNVVAQACLPATTPATSLLFASRPFYVIIHKRRSSGLFTSNNSCHKTTNVSPVKKNSYFFVVQACL